MTVAAVAALGVLVPALFVLVKLFSSEGPAWKSVKESLLTQYIENTALLGFISFFLSVLFGVVAAWLVSAYRFPGSRFFTKALFLPLAIPTYIVAYNYADIFGYGGLFESFQTQWFGMEAPWRPDVRNRWMLALLYALVLFPYVFIPSRMIFTGRLAVFAEAGRSLKLSEAGVFWRIMVPMAWPAAAAGGFLVLMEVWNDYGAAKYFGVNTLTTGIFYTWWTRSDLGSAVRLASMMVFAIFGLMWLERWLRGKSRSMEQGTGRVPEPIRISPLGRAFAFFWCGGLFVAGFALVALNLVMRAWNVRDKISWPQMADAAMNGGMLALAGALIIGVISLFVVYNHHYHRSGLSSLLMRGSSVGYAMPGAVIAVGVLALSASMGMRIAAIGTAVLLVYAVVVRFFAVGVQQWLPAFERIPSSRDEAALAMGKSAGFTLFRLHMPLMYRHAVGLLILVFIDLLKELPLTLILKPFNFHTLATRTYELAENEMLARASVPALMIVVCGIIPLVVGSYLLGGKRG